MLAANLYSLSVKLFVNFTMDKTHNQYLVVPLHHSIREDKLS